MSPVVGAVAAIALLALGCSPTGSATPTATTSPSLAAPSASPTRTAPSAPIATGAVAIEMTLLDFLPATVDGLPLTESPEAEAVAFGDPQLATVGTALVAGIAVDATSGQFVYAVVVRLIPKAMDDRVFRDWRDTYDEGACSQAGGVSGNAQAQIAGRTVYIGTCGGGVRTYHVWLQTQDLLVSASSVGDRRLGEKLMDALRVP